MATRNMPLLLRAGVFKPAFTLEYAQAAADTLFLERAAVVDAVGGLVAGAGRVGAQVGVGGSRGQAVLLLTGGRTGPGAGSDQRAVLGRAAGLALKGDGLALHLGASATWLFRVPGDGAGRALTVSEQPELMIDDASPSLSTGAIAARGAWAAGAELGLGLGRLWAQGEAYRLAVQRPGAGRGALLRVVRAGGLRAVRAAARLGRRLRRLGAAQAGGARSRRGPLGHAGGRRAPVGAGAERRRGAGRAAAGLDRGADLVPGRPAAAVAGVRGGGGHRGRGAAPAAGGGRTGSGGVLRAGLAASGRSENPPRPQRPKGTKVFWFFFSKKNRFFFFSRRSAPTAPRAAVRGPCSR